MVRILRVAARFCLFASLVPMLAGCVTPGRLSDVQTARTALLGFTEEDMRMCAGFPSRTADLGEGRTIWSYEADERSSGISLSAPILFGAGSTNLNLPSGGSCRAQFRFADGRVDRIAYAGNNDSARGRDALCASVVDDCLAYGRAYAKGSFARRGAAD